MKIEVHHYHHFDDTASKQLNAALASIISKESVIMSAITDIQDKLTKLQADVTAETTVEKSVLTLLTGLVASLKDVQAQLAVALAGNDVTGLKAISDTVDAVTTSVEANLAALTQAVTDNTPTPLTPPSA